MTVGTTITWNGNPVARTVGNWTRSLRGQPEWGPLDWPGLSREVPQWGGVYSGPGTPAPRQGLLTIQSVWSGASKPTTDMRYHLREEMNALAAEFSPSLGERRLVVTDTGADGGETVTRLLLARAGRAYSYRDSLNADGSIGGRPIGRVVYSVDFTSVWPWWIREPSGLTGDHTGISSTGVTGSGTVAGGWRLKITAPGGQSAAPAVTVTIGGVAVPLVWRTGATWTGGDIAVLEAWWPEGQRAGVRSYILRSGAMREKGVWGLDMDSLASIPLIAPSGTTTVAVSISSLNSGGTCAFDRVALHEAF